MAEAGRTVRLSGLPTDTTEYDRLKDKLYIHFLRAKNGGGEIDFVTIVKATPGAGLITFEDSRVAQRVIQQSPHILEVDGKKYRVIVTEHHERKDPNKVILSLSATVDYRQLPGGVMALTSLHESHPDIQISYDAAVELYTLHGAYSKVQAALTQLLGTPGGPRATESKNGPDTSGSRSDHITQRKSEDQNRKKREHKEKVHADRPPDEYESHRYLTPGGSCWEDTEGAALQLPEQPAMSEDDLLLIVDADMFQYVQKRCLKEYQRILSQYGINVVDMTTQGLTSLFLQSATEVEEDGGNQERLKNARKAISSFFQENEGRIRRDQLPKIILSPRGGLQRAMEDLSIRFPKLLLNEDGQNIYIIGSGSDVSEAKCFLLDSKERKKKEDVASLLRYPSYDSGPSTQADERRVVLATSSAVDPADDGRDQLVRSEEDERRAEGARKYKLAARFKVSGLATLGSRPTDFSFRGGLSSPSRQMHPGPVSGHDGLSETAEVTGERVSRALAQNTGGDILFKSRETLPPANSAQSKTSLNSHLTDVRPKNLTYLSRAPSGLSGKTPLPPAESGSSLKRASSFSGTPQQKAQVMGQKSQDDSANPKVRTRARSSSFSNLTERDKREVYSAEITVSLVLWQHIKEAYSTRVDDLTSDVQVKERRSEVSGDLTLTLRGANSSKVSSSQLQLQKVIDSVGADFSVQQLRLSELGIADATDETLQACCAEVRSRFKKVTVQIFKDSVFLLGPKQLCSRVGASLWEVFSGDLARRRSTSSLSSFLQTDEDRSPRRSPQEGLTSKTNQSSLREAELVNGAVRKDPVIKEKVRIAGLGKIDGQKADKYKTGNDDSVRHVNGVTSNRQADAQDSPDASRLGRASPGSICVCGDSESGMVRTKCGATLCSKCLGNVHSHCRVCPDTEATPRGIRGKMSYSELHICVPGYNNNSAIKITYNIPDGIQEEGHPSPGQPFQGGKFEAFLPNDEKSRKLLPRLERAFRQGLTFTVTEKETGSKVIWDGIPHKTSLQGGKPGNGYPDSTYLGRLSAVLTSHGIEEPPAV